jgi:hypothetical protein
MAQITYTGIPDISDVVDYFLANDEHLIGNPIFADIANIVVLKHSLVNLLTHVNKESDFHDLLNYKKLIYSQLVHYCDSIEQVEELKEDYHELVVHRIYTGTEVKILSWIYEQMYGHEPEFDNREGNSPQGFLRYLKLNCKPDVTAHFVGLALQQFVKTNYPGEEFYQNEAVFSASYNYMVELVMETKEAEQLVKTMQEQQEELVWLRDQLIEAEEQLEKTPDDEQIAEQQKKHLTSFMTERLEMEFLSQVLVRLF